MKCPSDSEYGDSRSPPSTSAIQSVAMGSPTAELAVEFRDVSFRHASSRNEPAQSEAILSGLTFSVRQGETLVLLGRSGSGKTTTLKLINQLLTSTGGEILVQGKPLNDWDIIQLRRSIGYAIQEVGLFPHFTVERNITLVPHLEDWPKERIEPRLRELMHLVGLDEDLRKRYPRELSGGQRQRVGVARALAADPPILLMDEPFGALDPITRLELQREFLALQKKLQKTVVFVTHDLREALMLGSRIGLMEAGELMSISSVDQFKHSQEPLVRQYFEAFEGIV